MEDFSVVPSSQRKHGQYKTRFYHIWQNMVQRCHNPKNNGYKWYGAKGIIVSDKWRNFIEFFKEMGDSYSEHINKYGEKNTSIERLDNKKDYCFENCIWTTPTIQSNHTTRNIFIKYNGKKQTYAQWAKEYNIHRCVLRARINMGWSMDEALMTPLLKHGNQYAGRF